MKKLFAKFRISNALDNEGAPNSLQKNIEAAAELREFAGRTETLDRALRIPPPAPPADPALHQSIMRAVRMNANAAEKRSKALSSIILTATGATALAAICIWLAVRPTAGTLPATSTDTSKTLAEAENALDMGAAVSRSMPAVVVGPLSNELASVDHDIRNTTQFVLAALP